MELAAYLRRVAPIPVTIPNHDEGVGAVSGTLSYTYDSAGNLESMSSNHTHGVSATYGYDDLNRLTSVVDGDLAGSNTTSYTYDNANNVGTVTYANGIESRFTVCFRQGCVTRFSLPC